MRKLLMKIGIFLIIISLVACNGGSNDNEEKAETINNTSGTTDNNGINNEEEYKPEEIDMGEEFEFETSDSEFAITVNDAKLVAPEKSNQSPAMLVDMTVENIGDEEVEFIDLESFFHITTDYTLKEPADPVDGQHYQNIIQETEEDFDNGKDDRKEIAPTEKKDIKVPIRAKIVGNNDEQYLTKLFESYDDLKEISEEDIEYIIPIKTSEIDSFAHPLNKVGEEVEVEEGHTVTIDKVESIADEYDEERYPEDDLLRLEITVKKEGEGASNVDKIFDYLKFHSDLTSDENSFENEVDKYDEYEKELESVDENLDSVNPTESDYEAKLVGNFIVSVPDSEHYYINRLNHYWDITPEDIE